MTDTTTTTSTTTSHGFEYDWIVIGGGSGGIASAKRAATLYGKKVALIERGRWGGTCVNVGCVPKKIMWCAATLMETIQHDATQYCISGLDKSTLDYPTLKAKRDAYIVKLNTIYESGLTSAGVTKIVGDATFVDAHTIQITMSDGSEYQKTIISGQYILIATGGRPDTPFIPGIEHCMTSDGFFEMNDMPQKAVVVGAGYIAVELAGVLNALGCDTHLVIRKHKALRTFDDDVSNLLDQEMQRQGITIHRNTNGISKVELNSANSNNNHKRIVHFVQPASETGITMIDNADICLYAPGRVPNTETLNLDKIGVQLKSGTTFIQVDEYQQTSVPHITALGDVCGHVELTPMAIAAGRRLADRLFGPPSMQNAKVSYELVPTVVFSHPTIGTCGLTETQAVAKYGRDNLKIYKATFPNLYYGIFDMESQDKPKTFMKLICAGTNELVVGLHMIGMAVDEVLQGFGVAMKMGATKSDFDACIAIHPTAAEELVTMGTWGTAPEETGAKHSPLMGAPPPQPKL